MTRRLVRIVPDGTPSDDDDDTIFDQIWNRCKLESDACTGLTPAELEAIGPGGVKRMREALEKVASNLYEDSRNIAEEALIPSPPEPAP